jgi:indole-3-glycerol phosphate synthase
MTILDKIIANKRIEIAQHKSVVSFETLAKACEQSRSTYSFKQALISSETGIISEFKRKSPSKGFIKEGALVSEIVLGYAASGASAISVLTDSDFFGGTLDDLKTARTLLDSQGFKTPLLRKEFIVDEYQLLQAKLYGADVILLIASALTVSETKKLATFAQSLGLEVLLEIHNDDELMHINEFIDVVGVNNRNLSTFVTDIQTSFDLGAKIPTNYIKISESGISEPETVCELQRAGFQGFLMGENFMKQSDPALALAEFIARVKK